MRDPLESDLDEAAAAERIEAIFWPDGPVCPHCGEDERIYRLEGVRDRSGAVRHGLRKCGACRSQFTVRIGTAIEGSHVPYGKWLQALEIIGSGNVSAYRLHRTLGVTFRTARLMSDRLAEIAAGIDRRHIGTRRRAPFFVTGSGMPLGFANAALAWQWSSGASSAAAATWVG